MNLLLFTIVTYIWANSFDDAVDDDGIPIRL